ncbi:MAG: sugar transferase [Bryobacterales bacterium]
MTANERPLWTVFERAVSALGLVALSPVLAAAAIGVVVSDGFPVLFRQQRVGRFGKPFELLKFRSMRKSNKGPLVTGAHDARITGVGRILRKYKLDELPQLWNVVRGDMSLIGPRPEVLRFVEAEDPTWRRVLSVRPGITDLASLVYRNEEDELRGAADPEATYRERILPRKLELNLRGIEQRSFYNDIRLILMTIRSSFFGSAFEPARIEAAFATGARKD